jgi:uroporphyrinogen-III synthase
MKVLVLRAEAAAARTALALEQLGHEAILAPLFELMPLHGVKLTRADADPPFASVIAASHNALTMLSSENRAALSALPAIVVGTLTGEAAMALGLKLLGSAYQTARELAEALETQAPPTPILYLAGQDRRPEIEMALRRAGHAFRLVEVYVARSVATLPDKARKRLSAGSVEAVLHYSERSATTYIDLALRAELLAQALAPVQLCISGKVAQKLQAAGAKDVHCAAAPEEKELLGLLDGQGMK